MLLPSCLVPLLLGNLGLAEIIVIVFVVLLLFGGRKIPELMHGLGKGISSFKKGMNDIQDEITSSQSNEKPTSSTENGEK